MPQLSLLEAEAVVSGFKDVTAMGETVEQGRGHLGIHCPASVCMQTLRGAEDRGPFAEAEVGGDDGAGTLVKLAQQVEQHGPAGGAEGQIGKFIQDHEVELGQAFGDLPGLSLGLFPFEGVDQLDGGEEADLATVMFDGLDAEGGCDIGFAGARAADQDHALGTLHELAGVQRPDGGLVDLAGNKVEACEVLVGREPRGLHVRGKRSDLTFRQFSLQELRQHRDCSFKGRCALLDQVSDGLSNAIHFEAA